LWHGPTLLRSLTSTASSAAAALRRLYYDGVWESHGTPRFEFTYLIYDRESVRASMLATIAVFMGCLSACGFAYGSAILPSTVRAIAVNAMLIKPGHPAWKQGQELVPVEGLDFHAEYFLYNITNPDAFVAGLAPPSVEEIGPFVRMLDPIKTNIRFDEDEIHVDSNSILAQSVEPDPRSCELAVEGTCSLLDTVVAPNRGFLMTLAFVGGDDLNLLLAGVPAAFQSFYDGMVGVFAALGVEDPATTAAMQFGQCDQIPSVIAPGAVSLADTATSAAPLWPPMLPTPELCGWAKRVATELPVPGKTTLSEGLAEFVVVPGLLGQLPGTPAADFVFLWALTDPAILSGTTGVPEDDAALVQAWLLWVATGLVGPGLSAEYDFANRRSGLLAERSAAEHVFGFVDPLFLAVAGISIPQFASLGVPGSRSEVLSMLAPDGDYDSIGPELTPFSIHTRLYRGFSPRYTDLGKIHQYQHLDKWPLPGGLVGIDFLWDGTYFGDRIVLGQRFNIWAPEISRPITLYAKEYSDDLPFPTVVLELAPESLAPCNPEVASDPRCLGRDVLPATWDQTAVWITPSVVTLPGFAGSPLADQDVTWVDPPTIRPWRYYVDAVTGMVVRVSKPVMTSVRVAPTTVFYPDVYSRDGVYLPLNMVSVNFGLSEESMQAIAEVHAFNHNWRWAPIALAWVAFIPAAWAFWALRFSPAQVKRRALLAQLAESTARRSRLYAE